MHNGTSVSGLWAISLFSWSFKQNARDTRMTTRVSFLASTLAFACTHPPPPPQLNLKRECLQSQREGGEDRFIARWLTRAPQSYKLRQVVVALKLSMLLSKTNRTQHFYFPWSTLLMTSKCSKLCSETMSSRQVAPLEFWRHLYDR